MKNNVKIPQKNPKKEELPSFLLGLPKPETLLQPSKRFIPVTYLGPLFFGDCVQLYPPPHPVNLRQEPVILHTKISEKNIFENWFLDKVPKKKKEFIRKPYKLCWNPRPSFEEPPQRKCPGKLKVFKRDIVCPVLDLGQSSSYIYGEVSREIPICELKSPDLIGSNDEDDYEIFTLSDLREKTRIFMTPKEKAVHAHFPKEFAMVRVHGPKIPEPLIVTSLPSKRKRVSDITLNDLSDQKSKIQKTEVEEARESLKDENLKSENSNKTATVRFTSSNASKMDVSNVSGEETEEDMEGIEESYNGDMMEQEM